VYERATPPPTADMTLGVGDTFDVRVFGEPELSGTYRVGPEGTITFPLAGVISVAGLEPQALAKRIADRLADGILRSPQVTVLVKEQTSKKVYVLGQVSKPGTLTFTPSMTVVEAITAAGGFTPMAAKNDTTITRTEAGQKTTVKVPVEDIGTGKARNVYLQPGDIISVPERLF
jgi:polysaccharide export outer membrane protein